MQHLHTNTLVLTLAWGNASLCAQFPWLDLPFMQPHTVFKRNLHLSQSRDYNSEVGLILLQPSFEEMCAWPSTSGISKQQPDKYFNCFNFVAVSTSGVLLWSQWTTGLLHWNGLHNIMQSHLQTIKENTRAGSEWMIQQGERMQKGPLMVRSEGVKEPLRAKGSSILALLGSPW